MKSKHQRLVLIVLALVALIGAGLLAASALKDEAAYFYTPSDVRTKGAAPGKPIRLGGMVVTGSLKRESDGVSIRFAVSDGKAQVLARFSGITPDLFREGSGVIAEGSFDAKGQFIATEILAKHDERYMPRELEGMAYNSASHKVEPAQ